MHSTARSILDRALAGVAIVLILKVNLSVLLGYGDYLPPNFNADFLLGRESYFYGPYRWAFYTHLLSGPLSLLVGTIQMSEAFRIWQPKWHRRLGRFQVACVLFLVFPSGLWMARYAVSGVAAGLGLGVLALATAVSCTAGWRAAVARKFGLHRLWMWRTYLLLCSAVIIRLIGGMATVLELDAAWIYPVSTWVSWLVPLAIFEAWRQEAWRPASVSG